MNTTSQTTKDEKLRPLILELKEKLRIEEKDFIAMLLECTRYKNLDSIESAGLEKVYYHLCVLDHINDLPPRKLKH